MTGPVIAAALFPALQQLAWRRTDAGEIVEAFCIALDKLITEFLSFQFHRNVPRIFLSSSRFDCCREGHNDGEMIRVVVSFV